MSRAALNATAASQVSDAALIAEVDARIKAGIIKLDMLGLAAADDDAVIIKTDTTEAMDEVDWHALEEAQVRFARRDYPETLWNLEKALGRDWLGLSDLVLGRRT
jgi:hypothetical protein